MIIQEKRFNSLRGKLLAIYFGIILGTFLVLSAILPQIISSYFIEDQADQLIKEGETITKLYRQGYAYNEVFDVLFDIMIKSIGETLQSDVWLVDASTGEIVTSSGERGHIDIKSSICQQILRGNRVQTIGNFYGYFEDEVLTVGMPIYIGNSIPQLILLHTEISTIQHTVKDMQFIITFVLAISLLVASILIYILSRDIITPINQMNVAAKRMANGNFNTKIEISTDDEVGQLAQSFNNMAEELKKLEQMRRSFIANISHDFRSPLTSIKGFVQAILDGTIPPEMQNKYLNVVLDETERLTKLTNDILHLTKMESNQVKLEISSFDLNEVIRKVLIGLEQRINEKNINVELIFIDEKLMVKADMEQIQRVIYNLLDNSIKFVEDSDSIFIETSIVNKKVHVSIIDTGPGIEEESLKKIFDRFHKGDTSRGIDKKGTGLGLAIVKEIIKKHGEEITVASKVGEGSAFTFTLNLDESYL